MTPDMIALLRTLLGLGGTVTPGLCEALKLNESMTLYRALGYGYVRWVRMHHIARAEPHLQAGPDTLYVTRSGDYSVCSVLFVTEAGRAALGETLADPEAVPNLLQALDVPPVASDPAEPSR